MIYKYVVNYTTKQDVNNIKCFTTHAADVNYAVSNLYLSHKDVHEITAVLRMQPNGEYIEE